MDQLLYVSHCGHEILSFTEFTLKPNVNEAGLGITEILIRKYVCEELHPDGKCLKTLRYKRYLDDSGHKPRWWQKVKEEARYWDARCKQAPDSHWINSSQHEFPYCQIRKAVGL